MYTADWNSIKLSAAYTYTWMESAATVGLLPGWVLRFPWLYQQIRESAW